MNPPHAPGPARFFRGRFRGGRPNYFFKRNGRTIPAHSTVAGGYSRRGGRGGAAVPAANTSQAPFVPPCSYLRPQFYAAPEDAGQQVSSIAVETPMLCPGWRLYFYKESYEESNVLNARLKLLETHYNNNVAHYDFLNIQRQGFFKLNANILQQDEQLKSEWPTLMDDMLVRPMRTLATFALAMHSLATMASIDVSLSQEQSTRDHYVPKIIKPRKIYARPMGFMAERPMDIVGSLEVDQLYCVRGVVTCVGPVDASATWIAYRCGRCKQEQALRQGGFHVVRPYSCKRQGCLAKAGFGEIRSSPFTRITPKQMIRITESRLDLSLHSEIQAKHTLDVELRHDLVDTISLGQEVVITGILRVRPLQEQQECDQYAAFAGKMEIFMKATTIVDAKEVNHPFSEKDIEAITTINGENDSFKLLVNSLAPEVFGYELAKAGVFLSLIGGAGSQVHDEDEINVLLVGDPGVGKSNIIQMCSKISLKGSLVQAKRGASSNNKKLTISVKGRSNHILECGGLLESRHSHCSIDDIDRLTTQMESFMNVLQIQSTCLAYPFMFSSFSTPTCVIASANSMRGHYDQSKMLTDNIRIPAHLLNEFHLVFLLLDKPNKEMDTSLSEHIRAVHRGAKKNAAIANRFDQKIKTNNSMNMTLDDDDDNTDDYDLGERLKIKPEEENEIDLLPVILLKKFIAYSRQQVRPMLTDEASEEIKHFYMDLRQQSENSLYSISSGHLAGLIRLCQARARIDFSREVTKLHVNDVVSIVKQSNVDMALGDYIDINPATTARASVGQRSTNPSSQGNVRKFIQMLQMRSSALSRRIFEFDELKDMARRIGISCGVTNLIDVVNLQGILLKKGPNMYEVMSDY
ncbi:DNA replication licensing factor REC isoform X1 [Stomoxys calcitrans]|uniref:DNA replication licensing factor REC isoform X1 n=1 Tax=Stomoxys calcitrans TaxID=35570 RepID=UPI0027E28493|nr:DNA replication licensing factor REC isoform X1 [Stomoxys calcitrans]